jgi:hypothetical protein
MIKALVGVLNGTHEGRDCVTSDCFNQWLSGDLLNRGIGEEEYRG